MGGPPVTDYADAHSECAYKDVNHWRHRQCDTILESSVVCAKCCTLSATLSRAIDRQNKRQKQGLKRKRVDPDTTPRTKRKFEEFSTQISNARKQIKRKDVKINKLTAELKSCQEKMSKMEMQDLPKLLEAGKISNNQVSHF